MMEDRELRNTHIDEELDRSIDSALRGCYANIDSTTHPRSKFTPTMEFKAKLEDMAMEVEAKELARRGVLVNVAMIVGSSLLFVAILVWVVIRYGKDLELGLSEYFLDFIETIDLDLAFDFSVDFNLLAGAPFVLFLAGSILLILTIQQIISRRLNKL